MERCFINTYKINTILLPCVVDTATQFAAMYIMTFNNREINVIIRVLYLKWFFSIFPVTVKPIGKRNYKI